MDDDDTDDDDEIEREEAANGNVTKEEDDEDEEEDDDDDASVHLVRGSGPHGKAPTNKTEDTGDPTILDGVVSIVVIHNNMTMHTRSNIVTN